MAEVVFDHVTRIYPGNDKPSVDDLNLDIKDGEFLVLVGPSGCGKSTLLNIIAGIQDLAEGEVEIAGKVVSSFLLIISALLPRRVRPCLFMRNLGFKCFRRPKMWKFLFLPIR